MAQRPIASSPIPTLSRSNDPKDLARWAAETAAYLAILASDLREFAQRVYPREYTTGTLPAASVLNEGEIVYVSDGGAGAVFQGSNGTAWVNLG